MRPVLSHVDLRVRDRTRAMVFYDALLEPLGLERVEGETFVTYEPRDDPGTVTWLGFTIDRDMQPGSTRISLAAASRAEVDRVAEAARNAGARNIEGPEHAYGPDYYAAFFEDPDGNKLEICCFGSHARASNVTSMPSDAGV